MPPTFQLGKRGGDLTYTGPMEAGMIAGFLWFQGTFAQFLVLYKSWERRIFQPDFLEVRLAEVKKKPKKNREKQQF